MGRAKKLDDLLVEAYRAGYARGWDDHADAEGGGSTRRPMSFEEWREALAAGGTDWVAP